MFDNRVQRLGFACMYVQTFNGKISTIPDFGCGTTTASWLKRQKIDVAHQRLWDLMQRNLCAVKKLITHIGNQSHEFRMMRIVSDVLPMYSHPDFAYFWQQKDVVAHCEKHFAEIGDIARQRDVRLSFHPGQFCCLASDRPEVVNRSIEELEYHATMAAMMGYGQQFQDMKINVHIGGKLGADGIKHSLKRLSSHAVACLTIENDEITWGLDEILKLKNDVALVWDCHHHFIKTGEYINANDDRIRQIIDSWRGVRPVLHYSQSRIQTDLQQLPMLDDLIVQGHKKMQLRAHSDFLNNVALNDWVQQHWQWGDIMIEAKAKNLATQQVYEHWNRKSEKILL